MKKVILSITFVLATGSLVNASSFENVNQVNCVAFAFEVEEVLGIEMSYERFSRFVDRCEASFNQ